jgi:dTDP-4-dehydrorhamnose reductase
MPRLLITGASGFLGWNLLLHSRERYEVVGTYSSHPPPDGMGRFLRLDLRDPEATERVIRETAPAIVIHAAAITSPALCMSQPDLARDVNLRGTVNIIHAVREIDARLLYTSTDRVFDGRRGWYTEEDTPAPLGCYEANKLAGEREIRKTIPGAVIVRLPLLYGPKSPSHGSFLEWMFDAFRNRTPLELFIDQFRTPLYAEDAARAIGLLLEKPELSGLFHLGGPERISRCDFGYRMAEIFGFDKGVIRPARMTDKKDIPPTPVDVSLNSDKVFRAVGFRGRGVNEGLQAYKRIAQSA